MCATHPLACLTTPTAGTMALFSARRFRTKRMADWIAFGSTVVWWTRAAHKELMALDGSYAEVFGMQAASYR